MFGTGHAGIIKPQLAISVETEKKWKFE